MAKEISLEGKVTSISRGHYSIGLEVIDANRKLHEVEFPLSNRRDLQSEIELIPYQLALLNEEIKFESSNEVFHDCGITGYTCNETEYKLKILSGPLKGTEYHHTKRNPC